VKEERGTVNQGVEGGGGWWWKDNSIKSSAGPGINVWAL